MSEGSLVAIASMAGAVVSAISAIIVAKINHDNARSKAEAEKTQETLQRLTREVQSGNKVTVASARSLISQIYDQNKAKHTIEQAVWESVSDLYDAYKGVKVDGHVPNSWCDSLVNEMKSWKKI